MPQFPPRANHLHSRCGGCAEDNTNNCIETELARGPAIFLDALPAGEIPGPQPHQVPNCSLRRA